MTSIPTNDNRAAWARAAIEAFQDETGSGAEDAIADLICDLCHLAAVQGMDPLNEIKRGIGMYADERDYPPDGWAPAGQFAQVEIMVSRS